MSASYTVWIDHAGDHVHLPFTDFDEALARAKAEQDLGIRYRHVRLVGDGYDVEQTHDGFRECSDGLTADERERVEGVLG